jgi:cysteine-S-conjugate beta-lyase
VATAFEQLACLVGTVHSPQELEALVRLARIYRVVLISDEIHAPLVLPGASSPHC